MWGKVNTKIILGGNVGKYTMYCKLKIFYSVMITMGLAACLEPQIPDTIEQMPTTPFHVEVISENLEMPWSVIPLPSTAGLGDYLVTERGGVLKTLAKDGTTHIVTGLVEDIYVKQQGGLFDVALAEDFEQSNRIYISYARGTDNRNTTALISAKIDISGLKDLQPLFEAKPWKDTANHFGGRIAVLSDETVALSLGDGFTYREAAQDKSSHLGKIIRIKTDGTVPKDNPFVSENSKTSDITSKILTYGHRNIQGLFYDKISGRLWSHEHGPRGGDELNLIEPGLNYGWPLATTGTDYTGAKISPHKTLSKTQGFVKDWVPSIAPSGLLVYRGDLFPNWNGDIFVGGLVSGDIRHLSMDGDSVLSETSLFADLGGRVRDVKQDNDGALLVLIEDPTKGKLLRISPR